jgi:hypothetical protein
VTLGGPGGRQRGKRARRTVSLGHCADHRIYSPKCPDCQAVRGVEGSDRRVLDDPLRTDKNWRRMMEIALRAGPEGRRAQRSVAPDEP